MGASSTCFTWGSCDELKMHFTYLQQFRYRFMDYQAVVYRMYCGRMDAGRIVMRIRLATAFLCDHGAPELLTHTHPATTTKNPHPGPNSACDLAVYGWLRPSYAMS